MIDSSGRSCEDAIDEDGVGAIGVDVGGAVVLADLRGCGPA